MKYFFMIATMLALACFFLSETKGEMFASGAAISLGIALFPCVFKHGQTNLRQRKEGSVQMVNEEELLYFCCDCGKQVQN